MSDLPPVQGASIVREIFGGSALPGGAHAGLVFDRYLRIWSGGVERPDKSADIRADLRRFVNDYNTRGRGDEHAALLREQHGRLDRISGEHGRRAFRTTFRLATGLGQEHPLENGFVFDPVLGVPFLPGTSVKGLLRAYMKLSGTGPEKMRTLLGHEPPGGGSVSERAQTGSLVVLPALPARWPELAVDVINCHHPAYYSGGRTEPVDWENPNPVYFLAVERGVDLIFRIALRLDLQRDAARRNDVAEVMDALEGALNLLGVGAKTATGYGVMVPAERKAPTQAGSPKGPRSEKRPGPRASGPLPVRGQTVACRLKGRNKKGKWRVEVVGRASEGVLDPEGVPPDLSEGQEVVLVVEHTSVNADWALKWPKIK